MSEKKYRYLPQVNTATADKEVPPPKGEQPCPCCSYITIPDGGECTAYICPVCLWEMDAFLQSADEPSDQNYGLTLRQAQENYHRCGAVLERLKPYCREPKAEEFPPETGE